jgi:hypothetical protein
MATRGFRTIKITFKGSQVSVYASKRIADALSEIEKDMLVFHGVKLHQVLEAVYNQGVKDGRAEVFSLMDRGVADAKKVLPHRRPGRPRRRAA